MGHLNQLHEEFEDQGLSILAVTSEPSSPTERWVESQRVAYPYAYDPGGELARWFGVRGIPHAVLVDPDGTIVWSGHPDGLERAQIEQATAAALRLPTWRWPAAARKAATAYEKGRLDQALALLEGVDAEVRTAIEPQVRRVLAARRQALEAARDAGDWLAVETRARALSASAPGLPEGTLADELLAELKADKQKRAIRDALEDLLELAQSDVGKESRLERALGKVDKLREQHAGTIVETRAEQVGVRLRARAQ